MSASELIDLSTAEHRTVTEYPETPEEFESLLGDLVSSSDGDVHTADYSGAGCSGPESRGRIGIVSEDGWSVDLIYPPA